MLNPNHMIGCDGELLDLETLTTIRPNYSRHHRDPKTVADIKATIRAGAYSWPGGYPLYAIADDGASLCFGCLKSEFRAIADSVANDMRDGWRVVGIDINYEDSDLRCDHCNAAIESACDEPNNDS